MLSTRGRTTTTASRRAPPRRRAGDRRPLAQPEAAPHDVRQRRPELGQDQRFTRRGHRRQCTDRSTPSGRRAGGRPLRRLGAQARGDRQQHPRQRVLEERRVDERVQQQRREGGGEPARRPRAPGQARRRPRAQPAEQQRERDGDEREVGGEADHALLGGDRERDRVRRRRRALGEQVLALAVAAPRTSPSRSPRAGGRANISQRRPGPARRARWWPCRARRRLPVSRSTAPGASQHDRDRHDRGAADAGEHRPRSSSAARRARRARAAARRSSTATATSTSPAHSTRERAARSAPPSRRRRVHSSTRGEQRASSAPGSGRRCSGRRTAS